MRKIEPPYGSCSGLSFWGLILNERFVDHTRFRERVRRIWKRRG